MGWDELFSDPQLLLETLKKADRLTRKVHGNGVSLERAILISWWCDRGSCQFCYMSTQKKKIKDKSKARRRVSGVFAEAELLRRIGWKTAFISGGYGAFSLPEIQDIAKGVHMVTGAPNWLNIGVLSKEGMTSFGGEVEGVIGSVETLGGGVRERICPGKPLEPIVSMFHDAKELGLKTGATIILGVGETVDDLPRLIDFVKENKIDKVVIYSLNPHEGTPFSDSAPPASLYQAGVIAALRLEFPHLNIVAGTWLDQLPNIGVVLLAGANGITKYPLFRMFGNRFGRKVEEEIAFAGRKASGTFTDISRLEGKIKSDIPEKEKVEAAVDRYIKRIRAGLSR